MGLQPRVHKQEAMKGFDMQRRTAQSGPANVWLLTAAFYILQSVGFSPPQAKQHMENNENQEIEFYNKLTCCA